jgi:uncharacterized protein (TIGR02118 family)
MAATLSVLYPVGENTRFDYDYYRDTHLALVREHFGGFLESFSAAKGLAGGPEAPPGHHAVFHGRFASMEKLQAALEQAGPLLEDIPSFTDTTPQMLIGEEV